MELRFNEIYNNNEWGNGSGHGSLQNNTEGYVTMLQTFLVNNEIKTIVDIGCGDWQFSCNVNWSGIQYKGYDIVKSLIEKNNNKYMSSNINFYHYSGKVNDLPSADLLIAKDVLQHWSHKSINEFLRNIYKYKYCLITNCVNPQCDTTKIETSVDSNYYSYIRLIKMVLGHIKDYIKYKYCCVCRCPHPRLLPTNNDILDGDFAYLNLLSPPFNLEAKEIYAFTNCRPKKIPSILFRTSFLKKVLFIDNTIKNS